VGCLFYTYPFFPVKTRGKSVSNFFNSVSVNFFSNNKNTAKKAKNQIIKISKSHFNYPIKSYWCIESLIYTQIILQKKSVNEMTSRQLND